MFDFLKKDKWITVNVISKTGLTATISQFGQIAKVPIVIKIQELERDRNTIRCMADTGFASEQVAAAFVMDLFGITDINRLIDYK